MTVYVLICRCRTAADLQMAVTLLQGGGLSPMKMSSGIQREHIEVSEAGRAIVAGRERFSAMAGAVGPPSLSAVQRLRAGASMSVWSVLVYVFLPRSVRRMKCTGAVVTSGVITSDSKFLSLTVSICRCRYADRKTLDNLKRRIA